MKNVQNVLNAILSKNVFEFILVDRDLHIKDYSLGMEKYLTKVPKEGDDVLEYLPEFVGSEEDIKSIFVKKYCLFSLESIYKNEYYVNISIEYCDAQTAIILLHNITASTLSSQKLLQYNNESTLLYNTLQKVVDNQNTLLFVTNNDSEIEFANQKLLDYFKVNDLHELKSRDLKLYRYFDETLTSYNDFYQRVHGKEVVLFIDNHTFMVEASQIEATHKLFTFTEATNIYKKKKHLELEIQKDSLTGIYKKSYFNNKLQKFLEVDETCVIAVLDLDNFKKINDTFGHQIGDLVLQDFTALVSNTLRHDDIFARWGGEEFLLLLRNIDINNALIKIENIRDIIAQHTFTEVKHLTSSFGVTITKMTDNIETILTRADQALYEAKKAGKNRVVFKKD